MAGATAGRNTSTGVEKTTPRPRLGRLGKKHLHGRGEDVMSVSSTLIEKETPPRAWRRPQPVDHLSRNVRNTSTGVEKTQRAKA